MRLRAKNNLTVHLTGGLGNQLFQYAAGLSLQPNSLKLDTQLGSPRLNSSGIPEIFSFSHPDLDFSRDKKSSANLFVAKTTGFVLRNGVNPSRVEEVELANRLIRISASLVLGLWKKRKISILQGVGIGFTELKLRGKNSYLIGYFQSHRYADEIRSELMQLEIKNPGPNLLELQEAAPSEQPLIVHYRFGDYLNEDKFGIPSNFYYFRAIDELWGQGGFNRIWVFSDDLKLAKLNFPKEYLSYARWVGDVDSSAAATLEAMRLGHGFVIANSTFSWWGAYLSYCRGIKVIAPEPWFQGQASPDQLLPAGWIERPAN
jgi:hypothetical protein